ncbi:sodium:proton antiporter [Mesorhizobium sp. B2-7-3]|uniref:cation:proton antiporter domain-containing protein n=1 Tax=Mesorhizobium sp. B2-7-3 TaxID=2589907 RepID=UPI00112BD02A|nr:cation:proton antiporter [Mesorhizobium sp. B2-7-3]TPJ14365.1 sodium:proton antiporter [Mesorhizobium sp. B2-7-3]
MSSFNGALALGAGTVLVLGLLGGYVKNRLWLAESTICLILGAVLGPMGLGWADLASLPLDPFALLKEAARLTLGISVMAAALRLPPGFVARRAAGLAIVLGPGMLLMFLSGSLLALTILNQRPLVALLVGAALAPTDPVVAGAITAGRAAERMVPNRMRSLLTAESGANDGLALLFVTLPALVVAQAPVEALSEWLTQVLLWQTMGSVSIGLVLGWLAGHLLTWARRQPFCQHHSIATIALALSLTVLAFVRLIGSDGILAVFASGLVINSFVSKEEARQENVQAAVSRFFDLPVFILVGTMLPWAAWHELGWRAIGFAVAVLIVRRVPWWVALYRAVPEIRTMSEAVFLGWFGPIGISTIYYLLLIREKTGLHEVWEIGTIAVSLSVVVHGMSATPFTQLIGRARTTSGQAQQGS